MPHSLYADQKLTRNTQIVLSIALIILAAWTKHAPAQTLPASINGPQFRLPEVILVPLKSAGQSVIAHGWILHYRNGLLGPKAPDTVIESRNVTLSPDREKFRNGVISWKIVRTRNSSCASATSPSCPDRIQILSVPKGFMAVPESALVDEGTGLQIFIVRVGIG